MNRHLVLYYGRQGSTIVYNHISKTYCDPEFKFLDSGFSTTEIHKDSHLVFYDSIMKYNQKHNNDWAFKYHLLAGAQTTQNENEWDLTGSRIFFNNLGVTNLHVCFRTDIIDTICSYMIADRDGSWVVTSGEIREHKPRFYDVDYIKRIVSNYKKGYYLHNAYVNTFYKKINMKFYQYDKLKDIFDINNDRYGMKKQLSKEQKISLIENYEDVEQAVHESGLSDMIINPKTGVIQGK